MPFENMPTYSFKLNLGLSKHPLNHQTPRAILWPFSLAISFGGVWPLFPVGPFSQARSQRKNLGGALEPKMAENRPKRVKMGLFWGEMFCFGGCTAPLCPLASCLPPAPQPLAYDPCLQPLLRLYLGATAPLALPSFGHS